MDRFHRTAAPTVVTVVLNWNGWRDTLACLRSLDAIDYPRNRVLVVDNGSTDASVEQLSRARPDVELLETGANLGFAGGSNAGIRHAIATGADLVWLLNNDTEVEPGALGALVDVALSSSEIGLVGSLLYDARDPSRVQAWGGGSVRWWIGVPREHREWRPDALDYIIGASLLVKRPVFESIGLLDERFFLYWEDADFGVRARSAGWRLAVAPKSVVLHEGGGSASAGAATPSLSAEIHHLRSLSFFMRKHCTWWAVPLLLRGLLEVPNRIRRRQLGRLPHLWRAIAHGARTDPR